MSFDYEYVRILGSLLDDLEKTRIMNSNRIGALERDRGEALPHLYVVMEPLQEAEKRAEEEMKAAWRSHPLADWADDIPGCGEKLISRLIALIGDPTERPNPAKLWAYCGHGDPIRSELHSGMTQEELFKRGSPGAKKATYKMAAQFLRLRCQACHDAAGDRHENCAKDHGRDKSCALCSIWVAPPQSCSCSECYPHRVVYDERRIQTVERVHERSCRRCGPSGHPALPGSPWSDGHKHADALRVTGKRFLLDLWKESRAMYLSESKGETPAESEVAA